MSDSNLRRPISEEELSRRTAELPGEIPPGRDLWPGIAARLGRPGATVRRGHPGAPRGWVLGLFSRLTGRGPAWAVAAAAIAAALWVRLPDPPPELRGNASPVAPEVIAVLDELEAECARMADALDSRLAAPRGVDPAAGAETGTPDPAIAIEVLRENLMIMRAAIRESRDAFEEHPGRVELTRNIAGEYRERLSLLRTATRLVAGSEEMAPREDTSGSLEGDRS